MPGKIQHKILWHSLSSNDCLKEWKASLDGLTTEEAKKRFVRYGENHLPEEPSMAWWSLLFGQFKSVLIYILLFAAAINFSLVCQEYGKLIFTPRVQADTYVILFTVLVNIIVGYIQERKAQNSLAALKKVINLNARVMRDGKETVILAKEVVPGDIIILCTGDKVPADARLLEVFDLETQESALTGESNGIKKHPEKIKENAVLGERLNMVYTGTTILKGTAKALVIATGTHTELGRIAKLINETTDEVTPLQKRLEKFSKTIGLIVLVVAVGILSLGLIKGDAFKEIFTVAIAVSIAAIPEGLAVTVTIILALGMQRILKRQALVKKLASAETLGTTTVICTDKTGTLTEGKMQVTDLVTWDHDFAVAKKEDRTVRNKEDEELLFALHTGMICNDARINNIEAELADWVISGNLTEQALILAAVQAGLNYTEEHKKYPRLDSIPFDSEIKYMATLNKAEKNNIIFLKGAPEKIYSFCKFLRVGNTEVKLTKVEEKKFEKKFVKLSEQGLRVIGLAYKKVPQKVVKLAQTNLADSVFIGYIGIKDPLRSTSKATVKECQAAGIKIVMITGDHKLTAQAIAKELNLPAKAENIMEGAELEKISEGDLIEKVEKISVYARVSPEHKLNIVKAWQARGEIVAMTGDGINDSPALKAANIGVALGSGTQVAKETADLILLDDNFQSIAAAVEEGRGIFDNIKKAILYLMSDSFAEVLLVSACLFLGLPLPLTAAQILWINLITETLPSLSLTQEPKEPEIMREAPLGLKAVIMNTESRVLMIIISLFTALNCLGLFYYYLSTTGNLDLSRTLVFSALGLSSLMYIFSIRTMRNSIFKYNIFGNRYLIGAIIISAGLMGVAIYLPIVQTIVKTVQLGVKEIALIFLVSIVNILAIELVKKFFIKKKIRRLA